jgi:D-3-phosphoglycerate dehydrogenase / 2-oxoglutarate reductase
MGYKILLPQEIMQEGREYLESRGYELITGSGMEEEDIIRDIPDCDGIIVRLSKMSARVFDAAKKLKVVVRHGAGYDTVDLEAARKHDVQVLYCPTANSMSVAELAIFNMLYCSRNFTKVQNNFKADYYYAKLKVKKCELDGKTVGLIGCGNIGSRVAMKAMHGFNMKVMAYDPYKTQGELPEGVELVTDRDRIFKECDIVSMHCPANTETIDSVGKREFEMMKETAFFINTARGKLVKEDDLYEALTTGQIAAAALDVLKQEPCDPNHPLLTLENCIVAPHIGAATKEATDRASLHSAIGIHEVLSGQKPSWPVPMEK